MDFAPAISAKPSVFTRIYFASGVLLFSLAPMALVMAFRIGADANVAVDFETAVVAIAALQALLWFAQRRCGTADRPYWRSLLVIASCLSTGWTYIDVVLVPVVLIFAILLSCGLALSRSAPERMSRLVYWFYDHRMHQ
jgi:hypothetical protein